MNAVVSPQGPISHQSRERGQRGLDIAQTAHLLRRYIAIERGLLRQLAGWFLAAPAYETKYVLAYHALDHAEHVTLLRNRLREMRGGQVEASVEPALSQAIDAALHAPDAATFVAGAYGVLKAELLATYRDHLDAADPVANAVEVRFLRRLIADSEAHQAWYASQDLPHDASEGEHARRLRSLLDLAGGISGIAPRPEVDILPAASPTPFARPQTIVFDSRIARGELTRYEDRKEADLQTAVVEDFKVFFNEMYAAALLASILFDAAPNDYPWEFFEDVSRQFWDEARHSQFGAMRLTEVGSGPTVCNPVLFEQSQGMPVLHRFCYLTLGLETYFMPRKRHRVAKYADFGDARSQLLADQDWSDETLHVRFGKRWVNHLLEDDFRTPDDILEEVRIHLEAVGGKESVAFAQNGKGQSGLAAPF